MLHRAKFAVYSEINTEHKEGAACTIWNVNILYFVDRASRNDS